MSITKLTNENFTELLLHNHRPMVVNFTADWCNPCRNFEKIFEKVSEQMEDYFVFCTVDTDQAQKIAEKYDVTTIPYLLLFKKGKLVKSNMGGLSEKALVDFLEIDV